MVDFFGPEYDAAERLGILPDLEAIHYPISRLRFLDSQGKEKFSLPYSGVRKQIFDDRHFNFMRGELERVLYQKISKASVVRFGTTVESFQQHVGGVEVKLSDQSGCHVDLLVGGDGIHSRIRELAFGPAAEYLRFLGYHALAFLVSDQELSSQTENTLYTLTIPENKSVSTRACPAHSHTVSAPGRRCRLGFLNSRRHRGIAADISRDGLGNSTPSRKMQ